MPSELGTVLWLSAERGFAFLRADLSGRDLFFRLESARFAVERGTRVRFSTAMDEQGRYRAINVKRAA
jgi:cold shock CspA family protein